MNEGALFRQLRQDRGLTLKQVADELNSLSFVSKFEKGASNISLYRLERMLENINVTMEEFLFLRAHQERGALENLKVYMTSPFLEIMDKIAGIVGNDTSLSDHRQAQLAYQEVLAELRKYKGKWQEFLVIYIDILMTISQLNYEMDQLKLTQDNFDVDTQLFFRRFYQQTQPIVHYLYQVENWSVFEVLLFSTLQFAFPVETVYQLLPIAVSRAEKDNSLPIMREIKNQLLASSFTVFMNFRKLDWAKDILQLLEVKLQNTDNLSDSVQLLFLKGWYEIIIDRPEQGLEKCYQAISIYRILNHPKKVKEYQRFLKIILGNKESPETGMLFL